jgi:hypothetical protein
MQRLWVRLPGGGEGGVHLNGSIIRYINSYA